MSDEVEREVRSVRRQLIALKGGITGIEVIDPLSEPQGLRYGSLQTLIFPHEGILDAILSFAVSVWQFKDYLKSAAQSSARDKVEAFAEKSTELKIVADLANQKKHARVNKPRSGLSPKLGILRDDHLSVGVVSFDTSRSGMFEFAYNGKNRAHRIWVSNPLPIPFSTEIIVSTPSGPASKGDAVTFIYAAFKQWERLVPTLGIQVRVEFVE